MHNGSIGGLIVPLTAEEKSTLEQIKVLKSEIQGLEPQLQRARDEYQRLEMEVRTRRMQMQSLMVQLTGENGFEVRPM